MLAIHWAMAALAMTASTPQSQNADPPSKAVERCVAAEAAKTNFSGVISIARPSGPVEVARGAMAGPGSPAMRADAQFNLGSAGKMWTAVALAQLVDNGKVSLTDPIGRFVEGLAPETQAVTIRQLLTHSGGLGNFFVPENMAAMKRAKSLSELKPLLAGEKPKFKPGERSEYSNSGFLLLGLAIERASGQSYERYLKDNVFGPAGMTGSGLWPDKPSLRATGMTAFPELKDTGSAPPPGQPPGPPNAMPPPSGPLRVADEAALMGTSAGGGFSTAQDMQRFLTALFADKLTSKAMREALTSPQIVLLPAKGPLPAVSYGFGFGLGEHKGRKWAGHGGGAPGVNASTMVFPTENVAIVVLSNRDPPAADALARKILPILFDGEACAAP